MSDQYRFDDSVNSKTGKQKHVHYLNDKPLLGTSTVLGVLSKPLTWWASGLAVSHLGWIHSKIDGKVRPRSERLEALHPRFCEIKAMDTEQFLDCLDEAYKAHSVKLDTSAEAGVDMHAELESYVKTCIDGNHGKPVRDRSEHAAVDLFSQWAVENVSRFIASEAYCYSKRLWTGGIVDLVYENTVGNLALLDFKSAKEAYDSHFLQNAGYDIAISENGIFTKDGELVSSPSEYHSFTHYSVLPFGMPEPTVIHNDAENGKTVNAYKAGFEACVTLHKLIGRSKF